MAKEEPAFKILTDYNFGNNSSRNSIEMTAPVTQVKSEKIEMTAPDTLSKINLNKTRFNSPFRLWFLRRNEIWLEVIQ